MKRKLYIKRAVAVISFVLAFLLIMGVAQEYLLARLDNDQNRIEGFYKEEKNSLDVCIIGSSECYTGFSSVLAYKETGITSYPFCTESNQISMAKYELQEILRTQNPQLVIIEINGALYSQDEDINSMPRIHKATDSMPLNKTKIEAIENLIPEEDRGEFYFPFIKYHSAWDDYKKHAKWAKSKFDIQLRGYNLMKGASLSATTSLKGCKKDKLLNPTEFQHDDKVDELNPKAEFYLRDLLEFCKQEKLDNVVFARFPHIIDKDKYARFKRTNRAGEIINEYGYDFINLEKNQIDIGFDKDRDFYNCEHMNIYGQLKLTKYLCDVIQNDYGVKPHELTDRQKEKWDDCVRFYDGFIEYAKDQTDKDTKKKLTESADVVKEVKDNYL